MARDAARLEAYLEHRPHVARALQRPRLVRVAQTSALHPAPDRSPGKTHHYAHASIRDLRLISTQSDRGGPAAGTPALLLTPSCYEEIVHRTMHGRWLSHHVTADGDCSLHGVPACGQAYGIEMALRLIERPAIARVLPGQAGTASPPSALPWGRDDEAFEARLLGVDLAPAPAGAPTVAGIAVSGRGEPAEPSIPEGTPAVVERHATDLRETLCTIIQMHERPWLQPDRSRPLQDILPGHLADAYVEVLDRMQAYTDKANGADKRRRIDVYADDRLAAGIAHWVADVCDWLQLGEGTDERYELEGIGHLAFLAHADHLNALSLRADIEEMKSSGTLVLWHEAVRDLSQRYGITRPHAEALIKQLDTVDYTMRELFRTIRDVGKLGNLKEQKARMLAVLCGLILQGAMRGVAPVAYKNVSQDGVFNLLSYYEYYGAVMLSNLFNAQASSDMEKALVGMESWLNYQLLYCVFYGEPPKDDFNSLYNALLRGRESGGQLIRDGLTIGLPNLATLLFAAGAMTSFDYRLGLMNLLFLPATPLWARQQNIRLQTLHQQGVTEIDRSARAVLSLINAAVDLR